MKPSPNFLKNCFGGLLATLLSLLTISLAHAQLIYTGVSANYSGSVEATDVYFPEVQLVQLSGVVSPQSFNDTPPLNEPYSNSASINGTETVSIDGLSPYITQVQASASVSSTLYTYGSQGIAANATTSIVLNSSAPEVVSGQTDATLSFQFYVNQASIYTLTSSWAAQAGTCDVGILLFNTNNPSQIYYNNSTGGTVSLVSATGSNESSDVSLSPGISYTLKAEAVGDAADALYHFSFTPVPTPEPSTWVLMLGGLGLLGLLRIRTRRTSQ